MDIPTRILISSTVFRLTDPPKVSTVSDDVFSLTQRLMENALTELNDILIDTLIANGYDEPRLLDTLQRLVDKRRLQYQDGGA